MSKALAVLFTGVGASTVAVGGVALTKGLGKGSENKTDENSPKGTGGSSSVPATTTPTQESKSTAETVLTANLGFKDFAGFKSSAGGDCTKKYFNTLSFTPDTGIDAIDSTDGKRVDSSYFSEGSGEEVKGCLVVNWERKDSSSGSEDDSTNKKWKGGFRWLWAFSKGNKGFVLFATTKQSSSENQLDLEGGIYVLEKEDDTWKVKRKKEIESSKKLSESEFDSVFPDKGEAITDLTREENKDNWGFLKDKSDLSKLCSGSEGECPSGTEAQREFKGSWIWTPETSGSKTPDKWASSIETKVSSLFGNDCVNLSGVFTDLKGSWTKQTLNEPSKIATGSGVGS